MPPTPLTEQELLKSVLEPLLEDFQYWFTRSHVLLETQDIIFLSDTEQVDLLCRVQQAQQEVTTAKLLFDVTQGTVGIETSTLMSWHSLVSECWAISKRYRDLSVSP